MQKELTLRSVMTWIIASALLAVPMFAQQAVTPIASGSVAWSITSCPAGWTEYTTARGRAIVGLPAGGTVEGTVGTALSAEENRPVGIHTHATAETAHSHGITDPGHAHGGNAEFTNNQSGDPITSRFQIGSFGGFLNSSTTGITVNAAAANVTISNEGSVTGTNAPYVELRACKKN